jgi:hypothetical protein
VERFDMLDPMLQSFLSEIRELSKKKPDGPLNDVKIKMINRILVTCNIKIGSGSGVRRKVVEAV